MGRAAALGGAALVVTLALACSPASAQSPFGPPADLSDPQLHSSDQDVAIAPSGEAVVVWHRRLSAYHSVSEAAGRTAGGSFGGPVAISSEKWHSLDHHVAMDPTGNAIIVYRKSNDFSTYNLFAVTRAAGGAFSAPVEVSDGEERNGTFVVNPDVGMDAAGNAIATWVQNDDWKVHYAIRPAGGDFGPPQAIANPADYAFEPDYAVAPNGDAAAVWTGNDGLVYAAVRRNGHPFGAPQVVNTAGGGNPLPNVAMDAKGNAIVTWAACEPGGCENAYVLYSLRPAGGTFGAPVKVAKVFYMGAYEPEVAMAPNGEAAIAWAGDSKEPELYTGITAVVRPPGGAFGAPEPVTHPDNSPSDIAPRLAYDDAGNLYVAWRHVLVNDGSAGRIEAQALGAVRHPGGRFDETTHVLSRSDLNVLTPEPAAAGDGRALFTWGLGSFGYWFWIQAADHLGSATGAPGGGAPGGSNPQGGGNPPGGSNPPDGAATPDGSSRGPGDTAPSAGTDRPGTTAPGAAGPDRLQVETTAASPTSLAGLLRAGVVVQVRASRECRARIALMLGSRTVAATRRTLRPGALHVRLRPNAAGRRALRARGAAGLRVVLTASDGRDRARATRAVSVRSAR
jgi:hypothetical protein